MRQGCSVTIEGIVQGVGFRPFIYGLAAARDLHGHVRNDTTGVVIEVEGDCLALKAFLDDVVRRAPPLARIDQVHVTFREAQGLTGFRIAESLPANQHTALVAADVATCAACLAEMFDPTDRRYRYPFLNCTHCGPRLTIIRSVPYDRSQTTMAVFAMCADCRAEYEDPANRRFHAQPIACPACGPRLVLRDAAGCALAGDDALLAVTQAILRGSVVAVKGLGGYHLACDASNTDAVRRLRRRKHREAKPLAVMVRDIAAARALCVPSEPEEALLASASRPIVLLRKRAPCPLADEVAPANPYLGVMLPYTPLHHLLLEQVGRPLVMTSGNVGGEPIVYRDRHAQHRLGGIADIFLVHDRAIETRCDDSVVRVLCGGATPIRRSRGYAPHPVPLPMEAGTNILAVGGDLKNSFALVRGRHAFLSHHIGDLADVATYQDLQEGIEHYARLLGIRPELVAYDLHPGYLSTRFATEMEGVAALGVQHHHAHVAACMAEHGVTEPVIGVAFDGTGYGTDGAIWGGEFLVADYAGFERAGYVRYVPLPGGDAAVRQPWRAAAAHIRSAFGPDCDDIAAELASRVGSGRWHAVMRMMERNVSCVPTSSVGRLFDAVAAVLGLRDEVQFEAQAAIDLEAIADAAEAECYPIEFTRHDNAWLWEPEPILRGIVGDRRRGLSLPAIAGRFHATVGGAILELCRKIRREHGITRVALTGGVFQNALLTERAAGALGSDGFEVLLHRQVPPSDGGLSLGQAAVACARPAAGPLGR